MSNDKLALRAQLLKIRRSIDGTARAKKDAAITTQLLTAYDWSMAGSLHIYDSAVSEVDTHTFCRILRQQYPHIAIDVAPVSAKAPLPTSQYDVVVVPIVGYDTQGNRLGMGAGWYDVFLTSQPTAWRIGLAYSDCFVAHMPVEPHDQPLDLIIAA